MQERLKPLVRLDKRQSIKAADRPHLATPSEIGFYDCLNDQAYIYLIHFYKSFRINLENGGYP